MTEPQQGATYDELLTAARTAEECGFEGFIRSDHYLKMSNAPTGSPAYTDAWTTLAGLARDTSTIRLGTLVTPVTFRAVGTFPVIVAEVDHMSGGRIDVGLGAGWFEEEHADYGLAFPDLRGRFDLLEDQLAILHGVWSAGTGSTFQYTGHTCRVKLEADYLRPAQRPHPPVVLGGSGAPRSARLAARYADEFNGAFLAVDAMKKAHDTVRKSCEDIGRDPGELVWSVAQVLCCGQTEAEIARRARVIGRDPTALRQEGLAGSPAEILDKMAVFSQAGAERFYLQLYDLSDLDQLRLVAEEVLPHMTSH